MVLLLMMMMMVIMTMMMMTTTMMMIHLKKLCKDAPGHTRKKKQRELSYDVRRIFCHTVRRRWGTYISC